MRRILRLFRTDARDKYTISRVVGSRFILQRLADRALHERYGQPTDVILRILVQPRDGPLRDALGAGTASLLEWHAQLQRLRKNKIRIGTSPSPLETSDGLGCR